MRRGTPCSSRSVLCNLCLVFPSLQDHGLMIAAYESGLWVRWKFPKNPSLQQIRGSTRQFDFMVGKENKRQILCIIILWFARFGGTPAFLWAEPRGNSSWLKMAIFLQTNSRKILSSTWPKFQLRWAHSFLHCGCAVHVKWSWGRSQHREKRQNFVHIYKTQHIQSN